MPKIPINPPTFPRSIGPRGKDISLRPFTPTPIHRREGSSPPQTCLARLAETSRGRAEAPAKRGGEVFSEGGGGKKQRDEESHSRIV
ncbi:MAG: hypothetical protein A3B25_00925 [Candidatus Ryanbacteria bacterium RIFCSPLOWO2_01_FULL_48_26]|uniref:Uncharacterized protein n=1 Tax=Candidatus Ryanbacteria bacterium RIFCSPLOWO2_01_FULL_48_26 TaxID=1802126 RepID=A0A1G2GRG5_9BACT|nr:MAG: hypothetical protein A3B25_00925 [Candidatus Ryanbacteria bacterium RIFCSPLOWO2_01_FULL_48_26]